MISSRTFPEHILLLCFLCCLCLLISCDMIYKRQVIIDFRNDRAKSFTVSKPEDLDNLFSRIEKIAKRNGLTCNPYNAVRKYHDCYHERVRLATYVKGETTVSIALTQFGPSDKTEQFKALEKDLSDFIKEEFPGKTLE
jgi:hypothetical protein